MGFFSPDCAIGHCPVTEEDDIMPIDSERLDAFLGKAVCDLAPHKRHVMLLGDRLGLYKALAAAPLSPRSSRVARNERAVHPASG